MRSISVLTILLSLAFFAAASPTIDQDKREPGQGGGPSVVSPLFPRFFCPYWLSLLSSPTTQFPDTAAAPGGNADWKRSPSV